MPWEAGARPEEIDVRAAAVVDGTTVVIGPPSRRPSSGSRDRAASMARQPNPSSTSRTTARAPETQPGNHGAGSGPSRAGTTPDTEAPA